MKSLWFLVQIVIFCEVPSWRTCVKVRQGSQHDTERQRGMHRVIIVPEQRNFLDPKFALAHSISVKPGCTCQFCEFCESKPAQISVSSMSYQQGQCSCSLLSPWWEFGELNGWVGSVLQQDTDPRVYWSVALSVGGSWLFCDLLKRLSAVVILLVCSGLVFKIGW